MFADDAAVVYVDAAAAGGDGTEAAPFATIADALGAAAGEGVIAIAAGTYVEDVAITPSGSFTLHGACASEVRVSGQVTVGAPGAPTASVVIEGVTIAPDGFSLEAPADWSACDAAMEPRGVEVLPGASAVQAQIRDSVIAGFCTGVYFNADPTSRAALCMHRSRVCANQIGVDLEGGAEGAPQAGACSTYSYGVVVSETLVDQNRQFGLYADRGTRAVGITSSLFELTGTLGDRSDPVVAQGIGIFLGNLREGSIDGTVVQTSTGPGVALRNLDDPAAAARSIELTDNVLLENAGAGIALRQLQAATPVTISGNVIRGTSPDPLGDGGDGIQVAVDEGTSFEVTIEGNTVAQSSRDGILLDGVGGGVRGNEIAESGEYGLLLQNAAASFERNTITASGTGDRFETPESPHGTTQIPTPIP